MDTDNQPENLHLPQAYATTLLDAMQDRDAPPGTLGHAIRTVQSVIHRLEPYCQKIQMTGAIRLIQHLDGITDLALLAYPKPITDLAGTEYNNEQNNQLLDYFQEPDNQKAWEDISYRQLDQGFIEARIQHYRVAIKTIHYPEAFYVAQICITGPREFNDWLRADASHHNGAMPWNYVIDRDYRLKHARKTIKPLKSEREVFNAIGYEYIDLQQRQEGNPDLWRTFHQITSE